MALKLTYALAAFCLFYSIKDINCSFIKANNVPRVGRSNEADGPFDQDLSGYVIKTNKNIPRMGRRNYDSESRYDIPKFYELPYENTGSREGENTRNNLEHDFAYSTYELDNNMRK